MGTNSRCREKDCLWTLYPDMFIYRGITSTTLLCVEEPSCRPVHRVLKESTEQDFHALSPSFVPRRVWPTRGRQCRQTRRAWTLVTRPILRAVQGLLESGACACRGYGGLLPFYAFLGIKDFCYRQR